MCSSSRRMWMWCLLASAILKPVWWWQWTAWNPYLGAYSPCLYQVSHCTQMGGGRTIEIFEITATSAFSTNIQSRFASVVLDSVLGPLRLAWHTWWCPCFSVVPAASHNMSWRPLKVAVTAQKALQGSELQSREMLVGMEKKVFPHQGVIDLPPNQWFFLPNCSP